MRNALVVGANLGDPDVLAAARELVDDEDPQVAATARRVSSAGNEPGLQVFYLPSRPGVR
ncbi:MAG: hypothetical protein Q9Q13_01850 [Acidobacteriota bacterium]|nr:hypothetical protein [Acidobacteriota bacterium]